MRNPGGHRLFELKLEGVCNGIALGALASPLPGAGNHYRHSERHQLDSDRQRLHPCNSGRVISCYCSAHHGCIPPEHLNAYG